MIKIFRYHQSDQQLEEEKRIIIRAQQDIACFEQLYNKYYEQIFRFIYKRCENQESAYDICSQVFLNAMLNLPKYEFRGIPFASWLYKIALNEIRKEHHKDSAQRIVAIESEQLHNILEEIDLNHDEEYLAQLSPALKNLPEKDCELISMRFFQELSFKEIGDIFEITEANAKMKVYRILEKLNKRITQQADIAS